MVDGKWVSTYFHLNFHLDGLETEEDRERAFRAAWVEIPNEKFYELRKCRCGRVFRTNDPGEKLCFDCSANKNFGAPKPSVQQPRPLKIRDLGEY